MSLALDPTDKHQSRDYIHKHYLSRGGSVQGASAGLQHNGLIYGSEQGYRLALPLFAFVASPAPELMASCAGAIA